jgi:hypothetical protein
MSLIYAESFDYSGLGILSSKMVLSEIHKRMNGGQKLERILFDLEFVKDE